MGDLAEFRSGIEPSVAVPFGDFSVHTCGLWCQGPVLAQMLRLVEATGCHKQPHNSFEYVHALTEIMKLAFADRHAYYGDPRFVDVPLDRLLSRAYAAERAALVRDDKAWPDMPPAGAGEARHGACVRARLRLLRSRSSTRPTCARSTATATSSRRRRATSPAARR